MIYLGLAKGLYLDIFGVSARFMFIQGLLGVALTLLWWLVCCLFRVGLALV